MHIRFHFLELEIDLVTTLKKNLIFLPNRQKIDRKIKELQIDINTDIK
ncbi:hypothetical protein [Buchnera aphidicola]|nr:hypothetical protein [Buchnera aphidicola]